VDQNGGPKSENENSEQGEGLMEKGSPVSIDEGNGDGTPVLQFPKAQLLPIVESIAAEPVVSFSFTTEGHKWPQYGVRGDKALGVFAYRTHSGREDSLRVFVKRQCAPCGPRDPKGRHLYPSPVEAPHYAWLAEHRAPVPRVYGVLTANLPDEREVLFIEWLDEVVIEDEPFELLQNDEEHFLQYLRAVARFNALCPSGEYASGLPDPPSHFANQMADWEGKLARLWRKARDGGLGKVPGELYTDGNLHRLSSLGRHLKRAISRMKKGFVHGDLEPFQTGRRRQTGEVLIFDFEMVGWAPRFQDIAYCLGAPDGFCPRCRPRAYLSHYYLTEYERLGGGSVPLDAFLKETRALWLARTLGWIEFDRRDAVTQLDRRPLLHKKVEFLLRAAETANYA